MKIKRLLAMLLSLAMVFVMFPTVALASEADIKFDIVLMQGEQAERKGVGLDFKIQTGSIKINTANVVFTYDTSIFELVDSNGTTLKFPAVSPYELKAAQLSTNSVFDDENKTLVRENTNQTAQVAMLRNAKEEVAFETLTSVGSYFLAYKAGKSITDVTVDSLRLATYDEATRLSQTDVIYVCDEDYNEFEYGTNGGNDDTENALKKDTSEQPPRYLVFFKGRDVDVMTQAFKEFSAKTVKQSEKPSLKQKLSRSREQAQAQHKEKVKVKTKDRGVEL